MYKVLCGWLAGIESDELLFNEHLLVVPELENPLAFNQFVVLSVDVGVHGRLGWCGW